MTAEVFELRAEALDDGYALTENFRNQWGLAHVGADRAYGNLALLRGPEAEPGAGVTIGFIDSGIDRDHPMFAGKTVAEQFMGGAADETGARFSHGTAVASVAAGVPATSPGAAQGVAWGADIAMFAIVSGPGGGDEIPLAVLAEQDAAWAGFFDQALGWRDGGRKVDFLNLSVGYHSIIDNYSAGGLRASFANAIAAMAQAGVAEKTVLVWGAGNAHGAPCDPAGSGHCGNGAINAVSVGVLPGLAARIPELRSHTVAVAALSPDGTIALFSNRCGIAASYCIAAPGAGVSVAYHGPDLNTGEPSRGYAREDGTSLAAPMVTGALALMKQIFRGQLSNTELVARLFQTADGSGMYSDPAVYGHGAMDLGAATSPVGVLEVPGAANADGFRLLSTRLRPGTAFGDGFRRALANRQVMALDALRAPFWHRLDSFTQAARGPSVASRLGGFLAAGPAWREGANAELTAPGVAAPGSAAASLTLNAARLEAAAGLRGSHLALAEGAVRATLAAGGGLSAAAFTTRGIPGRRPAFGAVLNWRRNGWPVGFRAGWIGEPETLLGSTGRGAFGSLAGDTSFVGVDARANLAGWRIGAGAELGIVAPDVRAGLLARVSPLATSAFTLDATRALAGAGVVRFSVSQPLRVERGRASFAVPAGRTRAGMVRYDTVRASLAPSGRQMDLAAEWLRPLPTGELRLGAVFSHRPGHRGGAGPELTFLGGWRWEF